MEQTVFSEIASLENFCGRFICASARGGAASAFVDVDARWEAQANYVSDTNLPALNEPCYSNGHLISKLRPSSRFADLVCYRWAVEKILKAFSRKQISSSATAKIIQIFPEHHILKSLTFFFRSYNCVIYVIFLRHGRHIIII